MVAVHSTPPEKMSTDLPAAHRCDVILAQSQYTSVPPPQKAQDKRPFSPRPCEIYQPLNFLVLSDREINEIAVSWAKKKKLLPKTPAQEFIVTSTSNDIIYYYALETYTEQRSVCMRFEPMLKEPPPSEAKSKREPRVWMVAVSPVRMFSNHVYNYRLINTDRISGCHHCKEKQWVVCPRCDGRGHKSCPLCKARHGTPSGARPCGQCHGKGQVKCLCCMGLGQACCPMCVGKGRLCYFKELRVDYRTHVDGEILIGCGLPDRKLLEAAGEVVHASVGTRVRPLLQFSVPEVNAASQRLVEASHMKWPDCKIIQQRHLLKAIPVTYVQYYWRGQSGGFYIYGTDNCVYWPDYPQCRGLDRCTIV